jgi:hypothetical protein
MDVFAAPKAHLIPSLVIASRIVVSPTGSAEIAIYALVLLSRVFGAALQLHIGFLGRCPGFYECCAVDAK